MNIKEFVEKLIKDIILENPKTKCTCYGDTVFSCREESDGVSNPLDCEIYTKHTAEAVKE